MIWQQGLVLAVIVLLFITLCFDRVKPDIATAVAVAFLWCAGILKSSDVLNGFGNNALATVVALYVVVEASNGVTLLGRVIKQFFGKSKFGQLSLFKQMIFISLLSTFINNTPLVAFFAPLVKEWARSQRRPASKFMICVSYSAILGGMMSIIGTSTTLIVQGLLQGSKLPPMSLFETFPLGSCATVVGTLFMCTVGYWLLPAHQTGLFRHAQEHANEFLTEIQVQSGSTLIGKKINVEVICLFQGEATALKLLRPKPKDPTKPQDPTATVNSSLSAMLNPNQHSSVENEPRSNDEQNRLIASDQVIELAAISARIDLEENPPASLDWLSVQEAAFQEEHMFDILSPVPDTETFQLGDRVLLAANRLQLLSTLRETSQQKAVDLFVELPSNDVLALLHHSFEVVLSNSNPILSLPAGQAFAKFSETYECAVLAFRRDGITQTATSFRGTKLKAADCLLVVGKESFRTGIPPSDFLLISEIGEPFRPVTKWTYGTLVILLAMFIAGGGGFFPMEQVAIVAALLNILAGFVTVKQSYSSIPGDLVVLIGFSFALGRAMETSGLAKEIANLLVLSEISPTSMLYVLYLVVLVMTEVISNNSAATLTYPIALALSRSLKVHHMPFIMVVNFAATCAFAVPFGYQCHLMVYGPGGYNMRDFLKVGIPMNMIVMVVVCGLAPYFHPF